MKVLHGDCLQAMANLPDESVDAVIMDPPYCSGSISETGRRSAKKQGVRFGARNEQTWFSGDNMGTAGLAYLIRAVAFEATRLMPESGSLVSFCDWRMAPTLAPAIESAGLRYQNLLVWDKGSMGLGTGFRSQHEVLLHFTNGRPAYHDSSIGNVLRCARVKGERDNPTQKPVQLIEQLIRVVCPPGGTVLDPFGGSGTTAVAAANTGRDAIVVERDSDQVDVTKDRLAATIQPTLFDASAAAAG